MDNKVSREVCPSPFCTRIWGLDSWKCLSGEKQVATKVCISFLVYRIFLLSFLLFRFLRSTRRGIINNQSPRNGKSGRRWFNSFNYGQSVNHGGRFNAFHRVNRFDETNLSLLGGGMCFAVVEFSAVWDRYSRFSPRYSLIPPPLLFDYRRLFTRRISFSRWRENHRCGKRQSVSSSLLAEPHSSPSSSSYSL